MFRRFPVPALLFLVSRIVGTTLVLSALSGLLPVYADDIDMRADLQADMESVLLNWTGGVAPYEVYRSPNRDGVVHGANLIGSTAATSYIDLPPVGEIYYYVVTGTCVPVTEICDGIDNDCDSYIDEGCGTSCVDHTECAPEEYCSPGGVCTPDKADGQVCSEAEECTASHCQNGYCCGTGDCCSADVDCAAYGSPAVCDDVASCQGSRDDGVCDLQYQCTSEAVADDSGCDLSIQSNDCGLYLPVYCSGMPDQPIDQAALCATTCLTDEDCDANAHCDPEGCVADQGQGMACDEPGDCTTGFCVDGVCCDSGCSGLCEECAQPGLEGMCSPVLDGQDPAGECPGVSCSSYYWGWSGDTCYRKADVSNGAASCDGAGSCRTQDEECSLTGQGAAALTCDDQCQDPQSATCTGTTPGSCVNIDPGSQSCGLGECEVTVPRCQNGVPQACVPGAPNAETCNDLDDNCDGFVDNGSFSDAWEPNGSCAASSSLALVGSNVTQTIYPTIYDQGDHDYYRIHARETDSTCSCCDLFCTDEDFQLRITLWVPEGAGSYMFCTGRDSCTNVNTNCQSVPAGQSSSWFHTFDGSCPGTDEYDVWVHIYGDNSPASECIPYTLQYQFTPGCY